MMTVYALFFLFLNLSAPTAQTRPTPVGWRYEQTTDRTGQPIRKASLTSENQIQLTYPDVGSTPVTLTIRQGQNEPFVYVEIAKGLFTRSFQGGRARVRFNGGRPVTYPLSAAANGRANIAFFDAAPQLIGQLRVADTVNISLEFAGQPAREIRFRTAGLRWK